MANVARGGDYFSDEARMSNSQLMIRKHFMKSITAEKAGLAYEPVAILWSNTKPDGALQIKPGAQTCIMPFFAQVVTKGKTAVFDRESYGCPGARAGLGFGTGYPDAF